MKKTHTKSGNKNNYALTYRLDPHPERISKMAVKRLGDDVGACDAAMVASIIYPPDGSLSIAFLGVDGRTQQPLGDIEMFKVWTMLGNYLAESEELNEGQRKICEICFEMIREIVLGARTVDPEDVYPQQNN